jgi:hypothetical protein
MTGASPNAAVFVECAQWLADVVDAIPTEKLDSPGLGQWTVHELVAHSMRGVSTVTSVLEDADPAASGTDLADAAAYLRRASAIEHIHEQVAMRGRQSAETLTRTAIGDELRQQLAQAELMLQKYPDTQPIKSIAGTVSIGEYLRTRIMELVVHGRDIQRSVQNFSQPIPRSGLSATLALLHELHPSTGYDEEELDFLTGRTSERSPIALFRGDV